MFYALYLTGDGWQFITYNGMMPVGETPEKLAEKLAEYKWDVHAGLRTIKCQQTGQRFMLWIKSLPR